MEKYYLSLEKTCYKEKDATTHVTNVMDGTLLEKIMLKNGTQFIRFNFNEKIFELVTITRTQRVNHLITLNF